MKCFFMSLRASSMKSWPIMLPMPRDPVQHHPHGLFGIETDFDEVVAATQRSQLLLRLLGLELRMLRRDDVATVREPAPTRDHRIRRSSPGTAVIAAAHLRRAVRHGAL